MKNIGAEKHSSSFRFIPRRHTLEVPRRRHSVPVRRLFETKAVQKIDKIINPLIHVSRRRWRGRIQENRAIDRWVERDRFPPASGSEETWAPQYYAIKNTASEELPRPSHGGSPGCESRWETGGQRDVTFQTSLTVAVEKGWQVQHSVNYKSFKVDFLLKLYERV